MVTCLQMGKSYTVKTPPGDFKVTTLKNSLLLQQAITSKRIPLPYTNLQLNPYPNTQLDLFCSDNLSFYCTALNMWLTNLLRGSQYTTYSPTWERCWLQSFSFHHKMKITKLHGYKTLRCTNTSASSRERWTRANSVFGHNLHEHNFALYLRNLWRPLKQSLYMFRVMIKESSNMYSQIEVKSTLKNWFS